MAKRLYRLPEQGQITGVAAGLGDYFTIDPTVVRVLLVILAFLTDGIVVLGYFLLAIILPTKDDEGSTAAERFKTFASDASNQRLMTNTRNWLGGGLILIGGWYLLEQLWPNLIDISWDMLWPLALMAIGALILLGRK